MAEAALAGSVLLVGLMAAQFLVHAAGWAMAAAMQRQAFGPEAHFAAFWLALAAALALQMVAEPSLLLALADAALVLAALAVHRGILLFYRQLLPDRLYAAVLFATAFVLTLGLGLDAAAHVRNLWVSFVVAVAAAATAYAFWSNGRRRMRSIAIAVAATLALVAGAMLARAGVGWHIGGPSRGALDAIGTPYAFALFIAAGLFNLVQIRLVLGRVLRRLVEQTQRDALTGVANRRGFTMTLEATHRRAQRGGANYGLMMIDIDHFKRLNDEHGHAAGDAALREVAHQLTATVRIGDTVGRLGGEEFGVLLPRSDLAAASGLAERVRAAVAQAGPLTVSVGVVLVDPAREAAETALARADAALYQAKNAGRNRVVVGS